SKLTEAEVLKLGALKGAYDKVPFLRFDEAAAGFLDWRRGLERRLRGDELSPALEGHIAKRSQAGPRTGADRSSYRRRDGERRGGGPGPCARHGRVPGDARAASLGRH